MEKPFYTTAEVVEMHLAPKSASHRGDLIKRGVIPPPIKAPGSNLNLWTHAQVEEMTRRILEGKEDPEVIARRRRQYEKVGAIQKARHNTSKRRQRRVKA